MFITDSTVLDDIGGRADIILLKWLIDELKPRASKSSNDEILSIVADVN